MQINRELVCDALVACEVGPQAKEEAGRLVEEYLDRLDSFPDTHVPTLGVEVPWFIELAPKIFAVGVMDRILKDENMTVCEWKTKGAPKIKKDGTPYMGHTEGDWLAGISEGIQLAVYALARRDARFLLNDNHPKLCEGKTQILVRACVKSNPPAIWPVKPEHGLFVFEDKALDAARNALIIEGLSIRTARKSGRLPWQMIGDQCHKYGQDCQHLPLCKTFEYPEFEWQRFHPTDPGFVVCDILGLDPRDEELVVISQSGYQTSTRCMEKYRREYNGGGQGEVSFELEIGTAYHSALAAIYKQLM